MQAQLATAECRVGAQAHAIQAGKLRREHAEIVRVQAQFDFAVAGADDPTSPPDHLEAIAAQIPGARLVVIPRGAHLVNVERADEFNEALIPHLA